MITNWINSVNTTSFRIVISVIMAAILATLVTGAVVILDWKPTTQQITVLTGVGGLILTMMGFDVIQFATKRRTDAEYVAAKQGPSPVSIAPPSNVSVTQDGDTTNVTATPTPVPVAPAPVAPLVTPTPDKEPIE